MSMGQQVYYGKPDDEHPNEGADAIALYSRFGKNEALALFEGRPNSVCDGQWVEFPGAVVGLMKIEKKPSTHFCDATRFHWYANKPYGPWPYEDNSWSIPRGILAARDDKTPIHLFVEIGEDTFVYVGQLCPPGMMGSGGEEYFGEAIFDMFHPVPSEILQSCGGLYVPQSGPAGLDPIVSAINDARLPSERIAAYRALVEYWRGPLLETDGLEPSAIYNELLPLPAVLVRFYEMVGACPGLMSMGYHELVAPRDLVAHPGNSEFVFFCWECQACSNFAVRTSDMANEDPQVFCEQGDGLKPEGCTVSEFLLRFYLNCAMSDAPYRRHYTLTRTEMQRLKTVLAPLQIKGTIFMPDGFFGGAGVLARSDLRDEGYRLEAGARTEVDLDKLEALLDIKGTVAN
jgi:hypothetical protein